MCANAQALFGLELLAVERRKQDVGQEFHILHPANPLLLLLAGEHFGNVEGVVFNAAVGAEHVRQDQAD